ncbi:MAG: sugar ABC transporter permease [Clostridiales bacterium]|nr:sugar ABC transporter permease [Clostridiales bacterium]
MKWKRKQGRLADRENRYGYLFVLPFVIGFVFLYMDLIVSSVVYSFSELSFEGKSFATVFVGLSNYKDVLTVNPDFLPALAEAVTDMLTTIPVVLIFSLFIATLLNREMPGRALFRSVFFIPVILMTGIVAKTDSSALVQSILPGDGLSAGASTGNALDLGNIEAALSGLSLGTGAIGFIVDIVDNIYSVVNQSGVQIILMLASLQSISPSIYEAASIEGATGWEAFWKITFPMLSPVLFVCAVYTAIDLLSQSTNTIMELIQKTTDNSGYGPASAMAWLFFAVVIVILGIIALIGRKAVQKS